MKRVIVTGANGFIGKALCRCLVKHNIEVIAVVRNRNTMEELAENNLLSVIEIELGTYLFNKEKFPRDIDVFYHLAWSGTSGNSLGNYEIQNKNIDYCCEAVMLAHEIECRKFILAGTINELECSNLMNADVYAPRKACIYGIAKLTCDYMCKTLANSMELRYNTAFIGSCFGPGDYSKRIHNILISNLLRGQCPGLIGGDSMHDWIYVDDVAEMFVAIGKNSVSLKNYYLGHCYLRRFDEILLEVRDIVNKDTPLVFGTLQQNFQINYSQLNINAVYEDTGYVCQSNFIGQIKATMQWVKHMQDENLI